MNRLFVFALALVYFLWPVEGSAKLRVVTTTTDLKAIVEAVGKDRVEVTSLVPGYQNPHSVEGKPSLVLKLQQADLLVIGRRGAGLMERVVLGSVADRIAHHATCPVLIVP